MTFHEVFRRWLRNSRERRCLTQAQLGKQCGLQGCAIGHFESGRRKPSFDNLMKIFSALDVSPDEMLDDPKDRA